MSTPGAFTSEWTLVDDGSCRSCGSAAVEWRRWESTCGGFEDHCYRCRDCGYTWWVEGPDA